MNNFPIRRIAFTTPTEERSRLVEEGKRLYFAALMKANGTQIMSPKLFDALLQFVDERLDKQHRPDPELAAAHNADPMNKDWQIDPEILWEQADVVHDLLAFLTEQMIDLNKQRQKKVKTFLAWLGAELEIAPDAKGRKGIEALTGKTRLKDYLGNYQKDEEALSFEDLWEILRVNKRRIGRSLMPTFMQEVRTAYEHSLAGLLPIKETLRLTDGLIDQIVYRLYGLTEEEIAIVEKQAD